MASWFDLMWDWYNIVSASRLILVWVGLVRDFVGSGYSVYPGLGAGWLFCVL